MKSIRDTIQYIFTVLDSLKQYRSNTIETEYAVLNRLEAFSKYLIMDFYTKNGKLSCFPMKGLFQTSIKYIKSIFHFLTRVPFFMRQAKALYLAENKKDSISLVLGLPTNRLNFQGEGSIKAFLASLGEILGKSRDNSPISSMIHRADVIFLFDPLTTSRFQEYQKECLEENIFIIDMEFIFFYFSFLWFKKFFKQLKSHLSFLVVLSISIFKFRLFSKESAVRFFALFIMYMYSQILIDQKKYHAIFFTNNSLLIELLRVYLIKDKNCDNVCEIMHGAATVRLEHYFLNVLNVSRHLKSYDKHFFIHQVPNLPLHGVLRSQQRFANEIIINPYLNYNIKKLNLRQKNEKYLETEFIKFFSNHKHYKSQHIVTLFGYYLDDKSFNISLKAEVLLISILQKLLKDFDKECIIVYALHPTCKITDNLNDFFNKNKIVVCNNSLFCWLISDLSLALFSSTLFEATHFGIPSFTPLTVCDGFYTPEYMNLLYHPKSTSLEDLEKGMKDFLACYIDIPKENTIGKSKKRLRYILS